MASLVQTFLSAQQSIEWTDTYAWYLFWFLICLLLVMLIGDLYHGITKTEKLK